MSTRDIRQVIIIGSGPAGYTAALYAARANLKPFMITGAGQGGQLMTTTDVENYPGYPKGVLGPEMMEDFRKQAEKFGAEMIWGDVSGADLSKRPFNVKTQDGQAFQARALIISTGASAKYLGLESEKKYLGFGVSACATCDGAFFKNKILYLVGGGDTAMEEAKFLTRFAHAVTVVHRRDTLRASKIMQERAKANPKIKWLWNSTVVEVLGADQPHKHVTGLRIQNVQNGQSHEAPADGLFLGIGHSPNSQLFKGQLELNEVGYILTKGKSTHTSVPGVFACGDVQDPTYRQAVTAAGSGCMAAIDAERWLESEAHSI
jgi:thioredoxin reductase (NADPH)